MFRLSAVAFILLSASATGQLDNSLNSGEVGVTTHWSRASFNDLRMEQYAPR